MIDQLYSFYCILLFFCQVLLMILHSLQTQCYLLRKTPLWLAVTQKIRLITECTGSFSIQDRVWSSSCTQPHLTRWSLERSTRKSIQWIINLQRRAFLQCWIWSLVTVHCICVPWVNTVQQNHSTDVQKPFMRSDIRSLRQVALVLNITMQPYRRISILMYLSINNLSLNLFQHFFFLHILCQKPTKLIAKSE